MLFKPAILRHQEAGNITIDSFVPENVGGAQVDVTLGPFYYRETDDAEYNASRYPSRYSFYNPYDESEVLARFKLCRAVSHLDYLKRGHFPLSGIAPEEELIIIGPGEMILAHTQEFIGSSCNFITTQMKARSSIGRNFLTVCACAGQGDPNFFNRWTFEIHNRNTTVAIPLVVGRRIAQILFFEGEPVESADTYEKQGKYQSAGTLEDLKEQWKPEMMLPRLFADRESKKARGE
jgi:dCTP deaminase